MKHIETTIKEILEKVNEFRNDYISNEQAVRTQLIEPILNTLGWKTSNPRMVLLNAPNEEGKIPDYTLLKDGKQKLVIEAKNLTVELNDDKVINQIANYCYKPGIEFGILTNGVKWLLFNTFQRNPKDRIVWQLDLEKDSIESVSLNLSSFSFENIDKLEMLIQKSKILENCWKSSIDSKDSIVSIIAQVLQKKLRQTNPTFKIDFDDLKTYTYSKLTEMLELEGIDELDDENTQKEIKVGKLSEFAEVENYVFKRQRKSVKREKISVAFPDRTVIKHRKVADTFVETIKKIIPEKIIPLNIYCSGVPLISETKDNFYNQHRVGKYWIMVHSSTKTKINLLNEINEKLNLNLKIEAFYE